MKWYINKNSLFNVHLLISTKKMHLFLEIISSSNNEVMAFSEQLLLNVNLKKGRQKIILNGLLKDYLN